MGFTLIQNEAMDMNMSDGAFRLYCLLQSYCYGEKDCCFPSQNTLSEKLRKSVRTIQRYINELVSLNLIKVIRRGSISNVYQMLKKVVQKGTETVSNTIKTIKQRCEFNKREKKNNFNNFQHRNYDMAKLEKLLLGRDSSIKLEDCVIKR